MNSPGYRDVVDLDYVRPQLPNYTQKSAAPRFIYTTKEGPAPNTYEPDELASDKTKKVDF
jgi:hypothetical protein